MANRVRIQQSKPVQGQTLLPRASVLVQYEAVRSMAAETLLEAARLLTLAFQGQAAAVCWAASNSVRLVCTHGLGVDSLARSMPKDLTWFVPTEARFSTDQAVIHNVEVFLGTSGFATLISLPLRSYNQEVIGSILVLAQDTRAAGSTDFSLLSGIAHLAMDSINARILSRLTATSNVALQKAVPTQLEQAVAQARESIICFSPNGEILSWNAGAEETYGYNQQEILGHSIEALIPSSEMTFWLDAIEQLRVRKVVPPREVMRMHKSGFRVQVRSSMQAIRDERGEVTGILELSGVPTDPARAAMIERFRHLVEHLPMLFVQMDASGGLTFIEGQVLQHFRRSQLDLLGTNIRELFADDAQALAAMNEALQGKSVHQTLPFREHLYETWIVPVMVRGRFAGCNILAVDVSEKMQTQNQLLQTEQNLQTIINQLPLLMLRTNSQGQVDFIGGGALNAWQEAGWMPDGQSSPDSLADFSSAPEALSAIEDALQGKEVNALIDWQGRYFDAFFRPLDPNMVGTGTIAVGLDITEREKTQRQLLSVSQRVEQLLDAVPMLAVSVDSQGRLTLLEGKGVVHFGGEDVANQLLGVSVLDVLPKDQALQAVVERALAGEAFSSEIKFLDISVRIFVNPILEQGVFVGTSAIAIDITDAVQSEQQKQQAIAELVDAQSSLAQQQAFAQSILETIEQGVTVTAADGTFEYVSAVFAAMIGYNPQDLMGIDPIYLIPENERDTLVQQRRERSEGWLSTYRHRIIRQDGSIGTVEVTGYPRKNARGELLGGSIAVVRDISIEAEHTAEIAAVQAKLEQQRQFADKVASTITQGFITIDAQGLVEYANQAIADMLGCRIEDMIGINPIDYVPIEQREAVKIEWRPLVKGQICTYRHGLLSFNQQIVREVEMTVYPTLDADQRFQSAVLLINDITEQQALEVAANQARRAMERESRNALLIANSTSDGLLFMNANHEIEYANPALLKMLGFTYSIKATSSKITAHPDDLALLSSEDGFLRQGQSRMYRYRAKRQDNTYVLIECSSYPRMEQNQYAGAICVLRDISAVQQQQRQHEIAANIADTVIQGLAVLNAQGKFEFINPALARLLHCDAEQLLGTDFLSIVHPEERNQLEQLGYQSAHSLYSRLETPNHNEIRVEISYYPRHNADQYDGAVLVITNLSDNIARELEVMRASQAILTTENELKIQQQKTTLIAELIEQGIAVFDANGLLEYVNPSYVQMLGYTDAYELLGRDEAQLIPSNQQTILDQQFSMRRNNQRGTYQITMNQADGSPIKVEVRGYPRFVNQQFLGSVSVMNRVK